MKLSSSAVRLALAFAAKTDVRYYLNGVNVEPHPAGGAQITGCDGHRVLQVHDRDAKDVETMILSIDKATQAQLKPGRFVKIVTQEKKLLVTDSNGIALHAQVSSPIIEAKYVDLAKVLGERESWHAGIYGTFNVQYIADIARTVDAALGESRWGRGVTVFSQKSASPHTPYNDKILFIVEGQTPAWGIVMGMRGDHPDPIAYAYPAKKAA